MGTRINSVYGENIYAKVSDFSEVVSESDEYYMYIVFYKPEN